jgi:hypothetical protein
LIGAERGETGQSRAGGVGGGIGVQGRRKKRGVEETGCRVNVYPTDVSPPKFVDVAPHVRFVPWTNHP